MDKQSPIHLTPQPREEHQTVTQWVYQTLRNAVMMGQILPGRAVTIRGIAEMLDVSPMPVREALRQLTAEQALEIRDTRRVMVPRMTAMKFSELCETRIVLESHSAARSMPYISAEMISRLRTLDRQIDELIEGQDYDYVSARNQQFHRLIYSANPHDVTLPLIESTWLQLGPFMRMLSDRVEEHYHVNRHGEALDAIEKQDAFALKMAISADIREGLAFAASPEILHQLTLA